MRTISGLNRSAAACPSFGLRTPNHHAEPVGNFGEVVDLERHQLGAAEGSGEAEREQRVITPADHGVRTSRHHALEQLGDHGRFALLGAADGAANPTQDRLEALGVGRRLVSLVLVLPGDGGGAAADGRGLPPGVSKVVEIGGDMPLMSKQRKA